MKSSKLKFCRGSPRRKFLSYQKFKNISVFVLIRQIYWYKNILDPITTAQTGAKRKTRSFWPLSQPWGLGGRVGMGHAASFPEKVLLWPKRTHIPPPSPLLFAGFFSYFDFLTQKTMFYWEKLTVENDFKYILLGIHDFEFFFTFSHHGDICL